MKGGARGWLLVNKPTGVVCTRLGNQLKRLTGVSKLGHLGTLDPLARGVLPLALGDATKSIPCAEGWDKEYHFSIVWGEHRTTGDGAGTVMATSSVRPERDSVEEILPQFVGKIKQVPPIYSAQKIKGKRAYNMAFKGEAVEIRSKTVLVHSLQILDHDQVSTTMRIVCGTGTYVRSITTDIAAKLNAYAYTTNIHRVRLGRFTAAEAFTVEELKAKREGNPSGWLKEVLLPIEVVAESLPRVTLSPAEVESLKEGDIIQRSSIALKLDAETSEKRISLWLGDECVGLGEEIKQGSVRIRRLFNRRNIVQ